MYSWRARIGVIAPLDDKVEYAFNKYAPDGVSFNSSRLAFSGNPTPENLIRMTDLLEETAKTYATQPHDVILFGRLPAAASRALDLTKSASSGSSGPAAGPG